MSSIRPGPVRVLVVDDDPVFSRILTRTFRRIPGCEVVAAVATLAQAKERLQETPIDVVTLDVVLQDESGLELLPWIQKRYPRVLTALLTAGSVRDASRGVDALLLGASTLILKPSGPLAQQVLLEALTRVIDGIPGDRRSGVTGVHPVATEQPVRAAYRELIVVGASTGGPPVVLQFLKGLAPSFEVPIALTQHMPAVHVPFFVELLAKESKRPVRLARQGERLEPGAVYVACDGKHLRIGRENGRLIALQDAGPEEHFCRPAVDPLFRTAAEVCGTATMGVIMTGMGSDGARGATALRAKGAPVVVQDRESSVVWGMPGATVAAGAATEVVPAHALAQTVQRWTIGRKTTGEFARVRPAISEPPPKSAPGEIPRVRRTDISR